MEGIVPIPSARPSAHAASTLPETYSIRVPSSGVNPIRSSTSRKYSCARTSYDVTIRLPVGESVLRAI